MKPLSSLRSRVGLKMCEYQRVRDLESIPHDWMHPNWNYVVHPWAQLLISLPSVFFSLWHYFEPIATKLRACAWNTCGNMCTQFRCQCYHMWGTAERCKTFEVPFVDLFPGNDSNQESLITHFQLLIRLQKLVKSTNFLVTNFEFLFSLELRENRLEIDFVFEWLIFKNPFFDSTINNNVYKFP